VEPGGQRNAFQNVRAVERSILRLFFHGSRIVPALVATILIVLALWPMLFRPTDKLTGTLASMAGAGLSFASVTLAAARTLQDRRQFSEQMVAAALMLLRFSIAAAVALALSAVRARLLTDLGSAIALDYVLRAVMTLVTALAIALAFLGFRSLVLLLGPGLDTEPGDSTAPRRADPPPPPGAV
jgi:hypothetical protein